MRINECIILGFHDNKPLNIGDDITDPFDRTRWGRIVEMEYTVTLGYGSVLLVVMSMSDNGNTKTLTFHNPTIITH